MGICFVGLDEEVMVGVVACPHLRRGERGRGFERVGLAVPQAGQAVEESGQHEGAWLDVVVPGRGVGSPALPFVRVEEDAGALGKVVGQSSRVGISRSVLPSRRRTRTAPWVSDRWI